MRNLSIDCPEGNLVQDGSQTWRARASKHARIRRACCALRRTRPAALPAGVVARQASAIDRFKVKAVERAKCHAFSTASEPDGHEDGATSLDGSAACDRIMDRIDFTGAPGGGHARSSFVAWPGQQVRSVCYRLKVTDVRVASILHTGCSCRIAKGYTALQNHYLEFSHFSVTSLLTSALVALI